MAKTVKIAPSVDRKHINIPVAVNGNVRLSDVRSEFSFAHGMKYILPSRDCFRAVVLKNGEFLPPEDGWKDRVYICACPEQPYWRKEQQIERWTKLLEIEQKYKRPENVDQLNGTEKTDTNIGFIKQTLED